MFSSCTTKLKITDVAYQSIRKVEKADANSRAVTPETGAVIAVSPVIDDCGNAKLVVRNLSDKIMVIDRTKSFFIDYSGQSTMYYDPTIRTSTLTTSGTEGATVNLGAIGSALGIGGAVGTALSGINVGGSNTSGVSKTTYSIDQPVVSIGPNGYIGIFSKCPSKIQRHMKMTKYNHFHMPFLLSFFCIFSYTFIRRT